ncbi:MAG: serine/threonine protein kinase, partial [Polyangiales bacterium]
MDAGATIRGGRYVVVGALGSGAQAETLDCVDKLRGTAVAIKRFSVRGASSWKDVELAEREARVLSSLDHHGLPKYIEHFEEDGALYLVMERIDGESLATI